MIIKSMSRKEPSFKQLLEYIQKEQKGFGFQLNMYGVKNYEILEEFQENHEHLKRQKNSNALYHEILSLKKEDGVPQKDLERALEDLSYMYAQARAKNCLVYAGMHDEKEHLHCHLMISSNEIENSKNHYMTKHQFQDLKKQIESYALEQYPEIKQEPVMTKKKDKKRSKTDERESQLKKRTGKQSKKDIAKEKIYTIFSSPDIEKRADLIDALSSKKMKLYKRGKNFGVVDEKDGKKYRLKTLGIDDEFKNLESRFEKSQAGEDEKKNKASAEEKKHSSDPQEDLSARKSEKVQSKADEMPPRDEELFKKFSEMSAEKEQQMEKESKQSQDESEFTK